MSMTRREMELRIKELFESEEILIKRITALEASLRECSDDLAAEIETRHPGTAQLRPSELHRYKRNMLVVHHARELLAGIPLEPEPRDQRGVAAEFANTFTGVMRELVDSAVLAKPPYPFCRTPLYCAGKGYCPNDIACNH